MKREGLRNPVIPHYEGKKKAEDIQLDLQPCIVCGKQIEKGYYGRWAVGGTCSRACEAVKARDHLERWIKGEIP